MSDALISDAVAKSVSILRSIVRSEQMFIPVPPPSEGEIEKVPSISDVFTVPSVQAAKINDETTVPNDDSDTIEETTFPESDENTQDTKTK